MPGHHPALEAKSVCGGDQGRQVAAGWAKVKVVVDNRIRPETPREVAAVGDLSLVEVDLCIDKPRKGEAAGAILAGCL